MHSPLTVGMAFILGGLSLLALATWLSPSALRYLAALLDSRAIALEYYRKNFHDLRKQEEAKRGL